jgi:hypothetical protein
MKTKAGNWRLAAGGLIAGTALMCVQVVQAQLMSFTTNNIVTTNLFNGTITLDGDIADFFQANGTKCALGYLCHERPERSR